MQSWQTLSLLALVISPNGGLSIQTQHLPGELSMLRECLMLEREAGYEWLIFASVEISVLFDVNSAEAENG